MPLAVAVMAFPRAPHTQGNASAFATIKAKQRPWPLTFYCLVVESPDMWLDAVRREERRGELLAAFDLAERGLSEHPDDTALKHRAVLALARAGATEEAARRFAEY